MLNRTCGSDSDVLRLGRFPVEDVVAEHVGQGVARRRPSRVEEGQLGRHSIGSFWGLDFAWISPNLSHKTLSIHVPSARKWLARGLVNFVSAVASHHSLNLPAAFSQPRTNHKLAP